MKWVCVPKSGGWTGRHKAAAKAAGFGWDGNDMSLTSDTRPRTPWGCSVRPYRAPAPPRKGFGAVAGILLGTHDQYGRPKCLSADADIGMNRFRE